jgi:hypothetical protein
MIKSFLYLCKSRIVYEVAITKEGEQEIVPTEDPLKMPNIKKTVFFLIIISTFASCKKAPVACFGVDKLSVPLDSAIHCDGSCSVNAKQYNWLGTGNKTTVNEDGSKAIYRFNIRGSHSISLQVTNGNKIDMISHVVNVY